MSYISHRKAAERNFDCLYDPNYTVPSDVELRDAKSTAVSNFTQTQSYTRYNAMFEDSPRSERMEFRKKSVTHFPYIQNMDSDMGTDLDSCLISRPVNVERDRMEGGANNPAERKVKKISLSPSECHKKAPGIYFNPPCPRAKVVNLKMSKSQTMTNYAYHLDCEYYPKSPREPRYKTRGMQTLYRESSAQTLPYLPEVRNENEVKHSELFKLAEVLPGEGPPRLHEVEVLERARKRWEFYDAVKESIDQKLMSARELIKHKNYRNLMEAFEWEHWLEREEYIQNCQMLRLEMVIRMFNEREKSMHDASRRRIEMSYKKIAEKREKALRRNEIEYGRQMRYIETKQKNVPRNWRKESITKALGDPSSTFAAPELRYGQSPCTRHFISTRKMFEGRIDNLEKHAINMKKLDCPFEKLKQWSKPKEQFLEIEQNFCSDVNLKKLYETLRGIREKSKTTKQVPDCLIVKTKKRSEEMRKVVIRHHDQTAIDAMLEAQRIAEEEKQRKLEEEQFKKEMDELRIEAKDRKDKMLKLYAEKRREEIEGLIHYYEGSTIGWLMRFLYEEMQRLNEQRKIQYISILAQKERWWRESAEAGLRQKENEMRRLYEYIYQATDIAYREATCKYLDDILIPDIEEYADDRAETNANNLARLIDKDIDRWLNSFTEIQNPLNYEPLRYLLKDLIFEDMDKARNDYEAQLIIKHIIDDVLFTNIHNSLETYDIASSIANNLVDRLIDTDLYIFTSPEGSDVCSCRSQCFCTEEKREARAILNKLIRYSTPGRRWKTPSERIAHENTKEIFDKIFMREKCKRSEVHQGECGEITSQHSFYDISQTHMHCLPSADDTGSEVGVVQHLTPRLYFHAPNVDKITRELSSEEKLLIDFDERNSIDSRVTKINRYDELDGEIDSDENHGVGSLKTIPSGLDVRTKDVPMEETLKLLEQVGSLGFSDIGIVFSEDPKILEKLMIKTEGSKCVSDIICNIIPEEEEDRVDGDADVESMADSDSVKSEPKEKPKCQCDGRGRILEITESEYERLLEERCRCEAEIVERNRKLALIKAGKIKIIRPPDDAATLASVQTFEYQTSHEHFEDSEDDEHQQIRKQVPELINHIVKVNEKPEVITEDDIRKAINQAGLAQEQRTDLEHSEIKVPKTPPSTPSHVDHSVGFKDDVPSGIHVVNETAIDSEVPPETQQETTLEVAPQAEISPEVQQESVSTVAPESEQQPESAVDAEPEFSIEPQKEIELLETAAEPDIAPEEAKEIQQETETLEAPGEANIETENEVVLEPQPEAEFESPPEAEIEIVIEPQQADEPEDVANSQQQEDPVEAAAEANVEPEVEPTAEPEPEPQEEQETAPDAEAAVDDEHNTQA